MHKLRLDRGRVILRLPDLFDADADDDADDDDGIDEGDEANDSDSEGNKGGAIGGGVGKRMVKGKAGGKGKGKDDVPAGLVEVDISLSLSAFANARVMFDHKKAAKVRVSCRYC